MSTPQDANPLYQDAPQVDPASLHDDAPAVDPVAAEEAVSFDDTTLPEMALPAEPAASTESPVPANLPPSPGTPGDRRDEDSAQVPTKYPAEYPTYSLLTDPAPADMEAIAATLQLDVQRSDEDEDERPTPNVQRPTSNEDRIPRITASRKLLSGGWTMGLLLSGIAIIAACVLIPQGDETRKLMYERESLRADLEQVQKQVTTNDEFLKKVQSDPTLAERLAQRQMKLVPAGTKVLDVDDASPTKDDKSPFLIVSVPPPAPMPPYHPRGGWFAQMCRNGRSQLYMIGGGLLLVAAGLVLGVSGTRD